MNLGDICSDQGNYKKALVHLKKSWKMLASMRESNQAQELFLPMANRLAKMALCHLYKGNDEQADKEAKWALLMTSVLPWTQNSGNNLNIMYVAYDITTIKWFWSIWLHSPSLLDMGPSEGGRYQQAP